MNTHTKAAFSIMSLLKHWLNSSDEEVFAIIFWARDGKLLKKIKYIKTEQIYLREWQKWQQLLIVYINIVTVWCYSWESQMYSNNYQALNIAGNSYSCIHTCARMLTFCVTAIIYYIIINLSHAFIKSTNMIYHNCVYQVLSIIYKIC